MKKNFTLTEIIIVVVIVGIVITFAIPSYKNIIEKSKTETCKINLRVLLTAVETYAIENDELPASLGQLPKENLEKSWAKILGKENPWKVKFIYWIVDLDKHGLAYAQTSWTKRYIGDLKYFTCPADKSPPPGGYSYGINPALAKMPFWQYEQLPDGTTVIADCDAPVIGVLAKRHKKYTITSTIKYAQEIKNTEEITENQEITNTLANPPLEPDPGEECRHRCYQEREQCDAQCSGFFRLIRLLQCDIEYGLCWLGCLI